MSSESFWFFHVSPTHPRPQLRNGITPSILHQFLANEPPSLALPPPFPSRSAPHRTFQRPARLDSSTSSSLTPRRSPSPVLATNPLLICLQATIHSRTPTASSPLNQPVLLSSLHHHPRRPSPRRFHPRRTSRFLTCPCSIRPPANGDLVSSILPSSSDPRMLASGT
jgi:hypothetical protein